MAEIELRNESTNEFVDISSEEYRSYEYVDAYLEIDEPQWLSVSASGGHRVLDKSGLSYYIPPGWIAVTWKAKEGYPHFVK